MEPLSQLYLRHQDQLLADGPCLWVNPPGDLPWERFASPEPVNWFTQDQCARLSLDAAGMNAGFGAFPSADKSYATIVLTQPREKARLRLMAACLAPLLAENGKLLVAGELKAGGRSAPRQLEPFFSSVIKRDSARHCVLHEARGPQDNSPFNPKDHLERWTLPGGNGTDLTVCSLPGVFAHGTLDAGTALLLEEIPALLQGKSRKKAPDTILDVGCGAGVLDAFLLNLNPELQLTAVDTNALAIESTRATLAENAMSATVLPSDGLGQVSGRFDLIISNPPFHVGHREREDLGAGIFDRVRNFLNPHGQLVLVGNRHLPWRHWMDDTFGTHRVLASNQAFHVLSNY